MHEMHEKFIGIKRNQEDVPGGWLGTVESAASGKSLRVEERSGFDAQFLQANNGSL